MEKVKYMLGGRSWGLAKELFFSLHCQPDSIYMDLFLPKTIRLGSIENPGYVAGR